MTTKPVVRHSLRNKNDVILLHCMIPLYDKLSSVIIAENLFSYIPRPVYCDLILHWYTFSYIAVQCNNVLFAHAHPTMFYYKFLLGTLPWYIESQRHRCTHTLGYPHSCAFPQVNSSVSEYARCELSFSLAGISSPYFYSSYVPLQQEGSWL